MKTFIRTQRNGALRRDSQRAPNWLTLGLAVVLFWPAAARAAELGIPFATPEDAAKALIAAAKANDSAGLRVILGPASADLVNPDRVQATNETAAFTAAAGETNRLVRESETRCVLELGASFWPFPVPIVKQGDHWCFDTEAGKDELLSRRIGRNELATLQAVRAYVEAQREYAARDRDGDEVLEYAQHLFSSTGLKDGLYWPPDLDGEISPLGPLVAEAQAEGYRVRRAQDQAPPAPYHGYFFKVITCQGKHAPGGKYDYIVNGNMIGGFGLVAWPAEYGETGVMTFIVNQQGRVYQKDLGGKTERLASGMKRYDPDKSWMVSPD